MDVQDLFGNTQVQNELLRDKFLEPPFSVLDSKTGSRQNRKRMWTGLGIQSELGRDAECMPTSIGMDKYGRKPMTGVSIFDPALCEVLYRWFCDEGGKILDPFAGGSVRGIVANYLGYKYTGIDIRPEQVESNYEQGRAICEDNCPTWIAEDSNKALDNITEQFDFVFSCPPYADLEVYSDLPDDISNMPYNEFLPLYESIIAKSCKLLKKDGYACFVVGEVRDKNGNYYGFVPDTIRAFEKAGLKFYNEAILLNALGTAMIRAGNSMKNKKLVKVHQNVLVFKKC